MRDHPSPLRGGTRFLAGLVVAAPLLWISGIARRLGWLILVEQFIAAVYGLVLALVFLSVRADRRRGGRTPIIDYVLAATGFAFASWISVHYADMIDDIYVDRMDSLLLAVPILGLTLEAVRRVLGWPMFGLILFFLIFAVASHLVPGPLGGIPTPATTVAVYSVFSTEGLFGRALIIVTTIVVVFIVFGQFFNAIGGGKFVTEVAALVSGRARGAPAKVAILSSGLFGSISGSVVSNVMSTGAITIPLMRHAGFPRPIAGGIEAVASTGGQLMPPVMGAAAFLMTEFVGVAYTDVVVAALVPALLFYFVLMVQTDQLAARLDIRGLERPRARPRRELAMDSIVFTVPVAVLIATLVLWQSQPETAGLVGVATCIVMGLVRPVGKKRLRFANILSVVADSGYMCLDILVVSAAAGIIIGMIALTGVGFSISLWMLDVGGEQVIVLLLVTSFIAVVLGLGLATTAIYILLGTTLAPALIDAGIEPLAAHLFVLYAGMFCMITPPIAFAAFAAASLAESDFLETAVAALRMGWCAFVLPFLFVFSPALLLNGSVAEITVVVAFTTAGLWFITGAVSGFLRQKLSIIERIALLAAGSALVYPANFDIWVAGLNVLALAIGGFVVARKHGERGSENSSV